ncbi:MAG: rhodanese-like domain-containing protein [Deltaproteobacteria bacterium]|jgi:rhodanese-related sulfurtransferase
MHRFCAIVITLVLVTLSAIAMAANDSVPRITKEELKAKMERGEDIIVLDVRTGMSYKGSDIKIKGAMRIPPDAIDMRYKELPMDKEIITYCT